MTMALLERVATLLRANLNDLVERAEDPLKLMQQVVLDMENQLLQVKTQVAIAVADHHLLERKRLENLSRERDWMRKAELAVQNRDEELARVAVQRSLASRDLAKSFEDQIGDQRVQVENLRAALNNLDVKLAETRKERDLLAARQRRARSVNRAADFRSDASADIERAQDKVERDLAAGQAKAEVMTGEVVDERFARLERQEEVENLLNELKQRKSA